ncbi:hypothetical protein AAZV13_08G144400 [Glycine max]|uniref:telomerase reverse transcriptase isoform X3 n=1 Tax=Glycine max TaxID=3847 RepID=UPI00029493F8|nr:telomerase reverse transcriptase isoform X3 [Glycine max]|eukprot:XP_014634477.1 telomerase reverse transcriptase isoform X3 [Glycine max]
MARKHNKKPAVPGVLWRMFGARARTLSSTIISLLPPPSPPALCHCRGRGCLGCAVDAEKFLLRPEDPSDYRELLSKCFVAVPRNAPSPLPFFSPLSSRLSQYMIVRRTIEPMLLLRNESSNVLCSGYDPSKCSSPIVELLSCASWCLLLSRVGDYFMFYLLRNTSVFLPAPHGKHHQVGGPPINDLCFKMLKGSSKFCYQNNGEQKRKRVDADDLPVKKQKCHNSYSTIGPLGFSINCDLTSKYSMQLIRHHGTRNYDVSVSEVPKSTRTGTVLRKLESEGKQGSNCITPRLGKRSRPFKWQRRSCKMQKQLNLEENSLNTHCNVLPTNKDCMRATSLPNTTSLSYHAKLQMPWQCSCCLILQSLPAVPKRTDIKRQSIFYNLESSHAVFPKKHILYSLKPNLAYSKHLIDDIFGFSNAQIIPCLHSNGSCLIDSGCLYHSLVKWFKHLIRRTRYCQHTKLLNKHCVVSSFDLDKNTIGSSKYHADTVETIDSPSEAFKSYCSKSQVVSFIWAVSRSLLPSELLGTPPTWRIMRRNISKFIHLRRFEKFPLKLCMHKLKISSFPFLSNKYFLNSQNASVLKYIEGKNKLFHQEFKNWNDAVHGVKHKLLEKWIFWYFSFLVVPLVQSNFYVTESEQGKQDIYYYPKPVWEKLAASTVACFKDWRYSCLDDVAVRNILRGRKFGFSKLRLQPKENGVRMVANLKGSSKMPLLMSTMGVRNWKTKGKVKNHSKYKHYPSVNSVLRDAHTILKGIRFKEPNKLGSSVFDYNDVYKKLCPFLVGQKKGSASMPNLFIVKSDVMKAFDSINQDKLLDIMKDFLLKDVYFLKQYDEVVCTKKSLWVQKQFTMLDETRNNSDTQFTSFASFHSHHGVFVNQERWNTVKKKALNADLMQHVKRNVLQFNGKFYLQDVGIPQGGVLSSLLCSMYYGHLERHVIFPFLEKTLECGSCTENNAGQTNYDDKVSSYMLMRFIDDFLFISTSKKQAASFFSRLERGFRGYNCHMNKKKFGANFDVEHISDCPLNRVYVGEDGATSFLQWSGLLINCSTMEIQADYTKYMYQLIKKQMHSISLNSEIQPILVLEKEEVEWLGLHAFVQVLKRKQSRHKELLAILRSRLSSHRMSERVSLELKYAINTKNSSLLWDIKY